MSVQILLQGKLLGVEEFLPSGQPAESLLTGRLRWVSLLSEILPRALIAELGLSKMLLGSSGGEQFLVVLPEEVRGRPKSFLLPRGRGFGAQPKSLGIVLGHHRKSRRLDRGPQASERRIPAQAGNAARLYWPWPDPAPAQNPIRPTSKIWARYFATPARSAGRPNRPRWS